MNHKIKMNGANVVSLDQQGTINKHNWPQMSYPGSYASQNMYPMPPSNLVPQPVQAPAPISNPRVQQPQTGN